MNFTLVNLIFALLSHATVLCHPAVSPLTLPAGTPIGATTFSKLNTAKLKTGDRLNLEVKFNVEVQDLVIVQAGTPLVAEVEAVDRPRKNDVLLRLVETSAVDGTRVALTGSTLLPRSGLVSGVLEGMIDPKTLGGSSLHRSKRSSLWFDTILSGSTAESLSFSGDIAKTQPLPKCTSRFGSLSVFNTGPEIRNLIIDGRPAVALPSERYTTFIFVTPGMHSATLEGHSDSLSFTANRCRVVYLALNDMGITRSDGISMNIATRKLRPLTQCDIKPEFWGSGPVAEHVLPKACAKLK